MVLQNGQHYKAMVFWKGCFETYGNTDMGFSSVWLPVTFRKYKNFAVQHVCSSFTLICLELLPTLRNFTASEEGLSRPDWTGLRPSSHQHLCSGSLLPSCFHAKLLHWRPAVRAVREFDFRKHCPPCRHHAVPPFGLAGCAAWGTMLALPRGSCSTGCRAYFYVAGQLPLIGAKSAWQKSVPTPPGLQLAPIVWTRRARHHRSLMVVGPVLAVFLL